MMSNSGAPGMQEITPVGAAAGGGQQQQQQLGQGQGQTSHRNVQFRVSAAQQQQLQQHHQLQQLQQQEDPHQQQTPTTPLATDPTTPSSALPPLNAINILPPQQHLQQQHSIGYSQQTSSSQIYQQTQQQQQQRPPIAPSLQPRLHHSASAGNIVMVANSTRNGGGLTAFDASSGGTGVVMPKKKDPYATAWRTYSKIAEELNLLNPDGTLYPISKEAILKYLHHQSKRIKSSNLHWYVNGLKKHQENLGFPWDDVRYDEQVVGLLKELTLHPVMMSENGDEDGHGGHHIYGSQPNRQRQSSSGSMYGGRVGGHYSSSSIDMTQIANLSISQRPHPSLQQQPFMYQQQQMQHKQQQQQQQSRTQMPYPSINPNQQHFSQHPGSHSQQHHHQQTQHRSQQQFHHQAPPPQKSFYSSAPILMPAHHVRTPSAQELSFQGHTSLSTHGSGPSVDLQHSDSLLTKRKRNETGVKKRRIPISASMEGEEIEEIDLQENDIRDDDDDIEDRRLVGMDDFDDTEEDPNQYQSLKRRASTGTLLSQARASAVKHVPGPYDVHASGSALYQNPASHRRQPSSGERGSSSGLPPHYQTSSSSRSHHHHLRSPSPDPLHDESSAGFGIRDRRGRSIPRVRDSPPESTSSCSSASSQPGHPDDLHRRLQQGQVGNRQQQQQQQQQQSQPRPTHQYRPSDGDQHLHHYHHRHHRHASSSGGSALTFSPMSGASDGSGPLLPPSATGTSSSIPHNPGSTPGSVTAAALAASGTSKNTVQFSEVAEYAQQLQVKYGTRCKDHPWGCVEIASGQHLELTIKMYLDWAGLVASGRLTMDELPDLPEFRIVHSGNVAHSLGGTLRRMASTPFIRSSQPTLLVKTTPTAEGEDSNMTTSSNSGASVDPYRSPSSSSSPMQKLHQDMVTDIADVRAGSSSTKDPIKVDSIAPLRLMSSPPSHGAGVVAFEKNDPHVDDHANLRKPRKMASTPSFHHHPLAFTVRMPSPSLSSSHLGPLTLHDQQQQQSNIRGRERQQQLQRRSVPTSPRRIAMEELSDEELDGLTDEDEDDDELERDEDDDDEGDLYRPRPASNQYALDPWSTLRRGGGLSNPIRSETKSNSRSKQEEVSITKVETTSTTTTEMDIEHEVAAIGEITESVDLERRGRTEDEGSAVDAAAQVLDSMKIGRTVTGTAAKDIEASPLISSSIEMKNDKEDPIIVAEEPSRSKISEIAGQESVEEDVVMT